MRNFSPTMATAGEKIRTLRLAKGWSMEKLAGKAGLTKDGVYKIETGQRKSPYKLGDIADALGVKLVDLVDDPDHSTPAGVFEAKFVDMVGKIENEIASGESPTLDAFLDTYLPKFDSDILPALVGRLVRMDDANLAVLANVLTPVTMARMLNLVEKERIDDLARLLGGEFVSRMVAAMPPLAIKFPILKIENDEGAATPKVPRHPSFKDLSPDASKRAAKKTGQDQSTSRAYAAFGSRPAALANVGPLCLVVFSRVADSSLTNDRI